MAHISTFHVASHKVRICDGVGGSFDECVLDEDRRAFRGCHSYSCSRIFGRLIEGGETLAK